ncbi:MAG: S-layer homology domain-containing protein, partial [Clostridia bacterium]|nr:S-layer homology domain-containing protein [Clostridia bacterium]
ATQIPSAPFVVRCETAPSSALATLSQVSSDGADAVFELWNYDLGDLSYVTDDLALPTELGSRTISWVSSNRNAVANTGRIERMYSKDSSSHLTATLCGNDIGFEMGFNATVIRANTSVPNNKYPELHDPMYMSDEAFFGKWDEDNAVWGIPSVLRYDIYPELSMVEQSAKIGDYKTAKSELIAYYRTKGGDSIYTFEPSGYNLQAEAAFDYIWAYYDVESLQGQGYVGTEPNWYTIDLTSRGKISSGAFGLIDSDMDGSSLEIYSKEYGSEYAPYFSVTEDGVTYKYPAIADTYVSPCDNGDTNYGNEQILYCQEQAQDERTPFSSDTKRPYFRFDVTKTFSSPTSITLSFYGRTTGNKPKKVYLTKSSNFANFDESLLTWNKNGEISNVVEIFNYRQTGFIFEKMNYWINNWKVEQTWGGYGTRGYQMSWLASAYLGNGNEDYLYRALELAITQYTQQPGYRYVQSLDAGWRMENIIRIIYTAINSEHMTDEVFTALMKWMYSHYDGFNGKAYTNAAANQANAVLANIARVCAYFPEFIGDGEWEKAKADLIDFYYRESNGMFNPDGSYAESCTNYVSGVIDEIAGIVRIVKARDGVNHPDYIKFSDRLLSLVTYYSTLAYASGVTLPYGDGGRINVRGVVEQYNEEFFNRGDLRYIASLGTEGTEPEYTSKLYPQKAICMMRSGWEPNSICAFLNNDNGGTHGHNDELALDVWAYGSQLLVDAGNSGYSPGADFTSMRKMTELHNTIVIDGKDQNHATANIPGPTELKTNAAFDFLHASTDKAYTGFDMHRKVLLLKNKYLIVSDHILNNTDSNPHTYTLYWHPDNNRNLRYDADTGVVKTTHASSPNVKIIVPDEDTKAEIHDRWMNAPVVGVTQSKSVKYAKESANTVTFDSVIYPQDVDIDDDIRVSRLAMDCSADVATAMQININANVGSYYSSNEEEPALRSFGSYSFDGEMAYVEKNYKDDVVYIAFTNANEISDGDKKLVYSDNQLNDFSAIFESNTLKLYGSEALSDGIKIATDKEYGKVTYNDEAIDFSYSNGYIITGNAGVSDTPDSGINSGTPSSPNRGESSSSGGGAGTSVVTPTAPQTTVFEDCKGHWAESYIVSLFEKGIVAGKTATEFSPDTFVTRAEFAKLIAGALGLELPQEHTAVFKDVSQSDWYSPYVNAVFAAGIISGYEDGTFKPNKLVTRQEMAKMLCVAAELKQLNADGSCAEFADSATIDTWATEYVSKSTAFGLFGGDDKNFFNPHSTATRAEASAVIYRLIGANK